MKNKVLLIISLLWLPSLLIGQSVGIGEFKFTPDPSAALEVRSSNKGILIPSLTETQKLGITAPATGLLIFQNDNQTGFYYYSGTVWELLGSGSSGANLDNDSTNELQTIQFNGDSLVLNNGGGAVYLPQRTAQNLLLIGDSLSITDGNKVSLTKYLDNTDNQLLYNVNDTLYLTNGGSVVLPSVVQYDNDSVNELQLISILNDTIMLNKGGGFVVLPQVINHDNDSTNELQLIGINNDTVTLSNGGFIILPQSFKIDNDSINELQTIGISNDTLSLNKGGGSIVLPKQQFQSLYLNNDTLGIDSGNQIDLSEFKDNLGDHFATQNLALNDQWLSNSGSNEGLKIDSLGTITGSNSLIVNDSLRIDGQTFLEDKVFINYRDTSLVSIPTSVSDELTIVGDVRIYDDRSGNATPDFGRIYFSDTASAADTGNFTIVSTGDIDLGAISTSSFFNWDVNLKLKNDGRVGIGTVEPEELLHVDGDVIIEDSLHVKETVYFDHRLYLNQDDSDHFNLPESPSDEISLVGDFRIYDDNRGATNPDFARFTFGDTSTAINDGKLNIYTTGGILFGQITQSQQSNGTPLLEITPEGSLKISSSYTLPSTDGSFNEALFTDGFGNLTWKAVGVADTVSVESGSFIARAGYEYIMTGNNQVTVTLPDASQSKGLKIVFYAYKYDNTTPFTFDVATNATSVYSVSDAASFTTNTLFDVISDDKVVTLISDGSTWVMLGAED